VQILIADDHAMVRQALRPFIKRVSDDVSVIEAATFHEAVTRAKAADELGLIILDLVMPGMNDVVSIRRIRSLFPDIPIAILSGELNSNLIFRTIQNGASGFIPKTYGGEALVNALRLILSGVLYIPPSVLTDYDIGNVGAEQSTTNLPSGTELNPQDCETLAELKNGHSNKRIAKILGIKETTVKKRLVRIYRKLGVSNRTQAVRTILEINPVK